MSVNPGFPAQKLIETSFDKVNKLKKMAETLNKNLIIQVDGGVNSNTAKKLVENGANCLVAGNFIFCAENYKEPIDFLKSLK